MYDNSLDLPEKMVIIRTIKNNILTYLKVQFKISS